MVSNGILGPHYGCFANCLSAVEVRPLPTDYGIPAWLWGSENERLDQATKRLLAAAEAAKGEVMTLGDWANLLRLSQMSDAGTLSAIGRDNYSVLLQSTEAEDEHPDDYDGHCRCRLCVSYSG